MIHKKLSLIFVANSVEWSSLPDTKTLGLILYFIYEFINEPMFRRSRLYSKLLL